MANQEAHPDNYDNRKPKSSATWREPPERSSTGSIERDETYALVSVLYHALQGAETYTNYISDAERAGEHEIARFFRECQDQENRRALRAKQLLAMQLEEMDGVDYGEDEEQDDEQT